MIFSLFASIILVVLDRISKVHAAKYLIGGKTTVIIPYILGLRYAENTGAAFSMMSGKTIFLTGFTFIAILVLAYMVFVKKYGTKAERVFLLMIMSGGIGNLIDRIFQGYVIDYFEFLFIDFAIFNVADCYVTVGMFMYLVYCIYTEYIKKKGE